MTTFKDLGVLPEICAALEHVDITHPFPIQALSLPISLSGTDMIGQARTGTGKTLAFGITVLQRVRIEGDDGFDDLAAPGKPQALILTPTRELALQVTRDLEVASTLRKVRHVTIYGGVSYDQQLSLLKKGVEVVVGTPGRLIDLLQRGSLDLSHVEIVVLDEADEMLDLGFLPDVEQLLKRTPAARQTLLFSATMPSAIVSLARTHLSHPVNIRAEHHDAQATVPDTTQFVYQAHELDKPEILGKLLQSPLCEKTMVFCKTKRACQKLTDELEDRGFKAAAIHGDLNQSAREKALRKFRSGKVSVLVATDVAARGIDIAGVSHVVNFECPEDEKTYIHRIGRTGRAGASGIAITLVDWSDIVRWKTINKVLNLDFDDPVETYSSSEWLMSDLGIPAAVKGRLIAAVEKQSDEAGHRRRERGGTRERRSRVGSEESVERPREPRKPSTRVRRRLRNGEVVERHGDGQAQIEE